MKFGSEAWVLKKREEQSLEAAQMKFLRHILGITKLDKEKNQCIRQKTGVQNIVKEIKQYQKKWLQHVQRTDTNRIPKQAVQYKPKGRRNLHILTIMYWDWGYRIKLEQKTWVLSVFYSKYVPSTSIQWVEGSSKDWKDLCTSSCGMARRLDVTAAWMSWTSSNRHPFIGVGRPRKRWRVQLHLEHQGSGNTPSPSGTWWWWWWFMTDNQGQDTYKHSEYVIFKAFQLQQRLRECASIFTVYLFVLTFWRLMSTIVVVPHR